MDISISDELNSIINFSREEAMRTGSYGIAPDHLFLGIIRHRENTAADALRGLATDLDEMKQFISEIGLEQYASVWVYRNQDENAKENYGICVDCFELSKSAELLTSVFA